MKKVTLYSLFLLFGIALSQSIDLASFSFPLKMVSMVLLGYIMIEVGLEFSIDKKNLKGYGKDYLVAMTAAAFPWIFCALYFFWYFDISLSDAAIIGRFAAPTSAGVLFSMLAAAGLAATWLFKKARILAILDDLDTILLMIPLQFFKLGIDLNSLFLLGIISLFLIGAWKYLHKISFPTSRLSLLLLSLFLVISLEMLTYLNIVSLEILLPAFAIGCMIKNPHLHKKPTFLETKISSDKRFDDAIKMSYMILVGASMPQIFFTKTSLFTLLIHVAAITFLANLGKMFPLFCYKKEASVKERAALSIAMWPRGEVGAGILLLSIQYALPSSVIEIATLSLALNLTLTGLFIYIVIWLLNKTRQTKHPAT